MKNRLAYIDSMRGLCIWIVVYSHIALWCTSCGRPSMLLDFMRVFFLSGFFFISGLMAYKDSNRNIRGGYIWGKCKTILIPTFVCGALYMLTHGITLLHALLDSAKCGYWFTFALFEIFILYAFALMALHIFPRWLKYVAFTVIITIDILLHKYYYLNPPVGCFFSLFNINGLLGYLPYFMLGLLYKRYEIVAERWLERSDIGYLIFLVLVVLGLLGYIPLIVYTISTTLLVYITIKKMYCNEGYHSLRIAKVFEYWGRNSLEIYFLHYFLLFLLPNAVGNYLNQCHDSNFSQNIPELIIVGGTAAMICFLLVGFAFLMKQLPKGAIIFFGKRE